MPADGDVGLLAGRLFMRRGATGGIAQAHPALGLPESQPICAWCAAAGSRLASSTNHSACARTIDVSIRGDGQAMIEVRERY
ncbi:MAG: hypothetical protein C0183_15090 [Roseiflexus castenholzii]|nr:MAG: hypothetical protein C0183_15090 [Roseiflexus castenholzii]